MNWSQYPWAVLAAWVGASCADALFLVAFVRRSYASHPEIWRPSSRGRQRVRRVVSLALNLLTCAVMVYVCGFLGLTSLNTALLFVLTPWVAVVLPLLLGNALAIQIDAWIVVSHAAGWLVKLAACGLAAYYFL